MSATSHPVISSNVLAHSQYRGQQANTVWIKQENEIDSQVFAVEMRLWRCWTHVGWVEQAIPVNHAPSWLRNPPRSSASAILMDIWTNFTVSPSPSPLPQLASSWTNSLTSLPVPPRPSPSLPVPLLFLSHSPFAPPSSPPSPLSPSPIVPNYSVSFACLILPPSLPYEPYPGPNEQNNASPRM